MTWVGTWRNQYGSILQITSEAGGRVEGVFRTALEDSGFAGQEVVLVGTHSGDAIAFSSAGAGPAGHLAVSYIGLLRDGRLETMWLMAADAVRTKGGATSKLPWWRAVATNADSFERVEDA